jgi:putative glutamine amidotransferase
MPKLATWLREKDRKFFQPFFDRYPQMQVCNAREGAVDIASADGLLLTGGSDIAPEFLPQEIPDPGLIDSDVDRPRDEWEFEVLPKILANGRPVLAICKGMQVLNVALGGTLHLDIPGHRDPEMKDNDIQALRSATTASHRWEQVNSSHHQAVDQVAEGFEVEAWCAVDDVVEQIRLRDYPFALGVQFHPERGKIYDALFDDFFSRLSNNR